MRRFCPESMRMSQRLRLTNIFRGNRYVENYTREFLRLSRYAEDLMRDHYFTVTIYVTGLGFAFAGMPTAGLTLEAIIELAKGIEFRLIRQGVMPDLYQTEGVLIGRSQSTHGTTFQIGSYSQQRGPIQHSQRLQSKYHKSGKHEEA